MHVGKGMLWVMREAEVGVYLMRSMQLGLLLILEVNDIDNCFTEMAIKSNRVRTWKSSVSRRPQRNNKIITNCY